MSKKSNKLIEEFLTANKLTPKDLESYLHKDTPESKEPVKQDDDSFQFNAESILTFVGGAVFLIGVIILVSFNWGSFSDAGKIFVTFGVGTLLGLSSIFLQPLLKKTYYLNIIQLISAVLLYIGSIVTIGVNYPTGINYSLALAYIFGYIGIIYFVVNQLVKKGVFTFLWLAYALATYIAVLVYMFENHWQDFAEQRLPAVLAIIASLFYMFIAYINRNTDKHFFKGLIMNIGAIGLMISTFIAIGYNEFLEGVWQGSRVLEHVYGLIFIPLYMIAQRVQSKVLLLSTSIGLFYWLMFMLNERYELSNNAGISFIVGGILLMAIGYFTFQYSKIFGKK